MSKLVLALSLLAPSMALAQEPPPADPTPAPAPPKPAPPPTVIVTPAMTPPIDLGGPPHNGFQIQGRLATQVGLTSILSPGFSLGYRTGNLVFGGQLGITAGKIDSGGTTDSFSVVQLIPMVYWDLWASRDRRARMNLVGGLGVGKARIKSESGGMTDETTADFGVILGGVGGDYWMHKNFALGVEVGVELPVLNKVAQNGTDQDTKAALQSIHGLLRFTFITGE